MRYALNVLIILSVFFSVGPNYCQNDWKLEKDKDGIKVYSRKTSLSNFNEFKGITRIDAPVETFISVLRDIEGITNWIYSVINSRLLETYGDTVQIYYSESKAPWPFKNRDAIYKTKYIWDSTNNTLQVEINCLPEYLNPARGIVRLPFAKGKWEIQEVENNKIDVVFQMLIDPGGNIPSWLANTFVVDSPFETLKDLRRIIKQDKYQNNTY